jgi:hypothetical protein
MLDYLVHFFSYNKIYLLTGVGLLLLVVLPTKGKISSKTRAAPHVPVIIWILCFTFRVNTGDDITSLFKTSDTFCDESRPVSVVGGPFNKYHSDDAGRKVNKPRTSKYLKGGKNFQGAVSTIG